jgi:glycosyltransferase involved in cell wall biosynthesis
MKLVLLAPASSVHTQRWANALCDRGIEVHVISEHAPLKGYAEKILLHCLPHRSGAGYIFNGGGLRKIISRVRPDVVNAHYATGYGTLARAVRDVPVVLNVWGSDVFEFPVKSALHGWWLRRNLFNAARLVATSQVMADRTHDLVPERPRPEVVPFGVDVERFHPSDTTTRIQGTVLIGTIKSLARVYGIDTLIAAFARVHALRPSGTLRLRIVGDGPDRDRLQRFAASLLPSAAVEFVGAVPHDRVPNELSKLDVFVALSRQESFGVAVIEASAAGLPVLTSTAGGLPEVVRDGVTGYTVPVDDVDAAAARLDELVASRDLCDRMGKAGREFVLQHYEWSSCVDRMIKVLEEAAQLSLRS